MTGGDDSDDTRGEDREGDHRSRGADTDGWDAARYDDRCAFVSAYGAEVIELLDLDPGDRVLDLGCGTGQLARRLVADGASVVGLDGSVAMIDRARERHGDVDGLRFVHGDARDLPEALDTPVPAEESPFESESESESEFGFDAVFSNAALHWIPGPDHDAVLAGVARLLRPDGAFVAELGGRGNVARIVDGVRAELDACGYEPGDPWYFPSVGAYSPRLESHGLEVRAAFLFDRPTELDGGADGLREWLATFGDGLLASVPASELDAVYEGIADRLRDDRFDAEQGSWVADYRRLRFRAVKQG